MRRAEHLASSDLVLLTLLQAGIQEGQSREEAIKRVLELFLAKAVEVFSEDVPRACILRPNWQTGYLDVWAHYGFGNARLPDNHYNIRPEWNTPRGVAAFTFLTNNLQVVQSRKKNGLWMGYKAQTDQEHPAYLPPSAGNVKDPRYLSFATAPIRDADENCIAVLDFDSETSTTFVDEKDERMIEDLAAAIGAAIAIINRAIVPAK